MNLLWTNQFAFDAQTGVMAAAATELGILVPPHATLWVASAESRRVMRFDCVGTTGDAWVYQPEHKMAVSQLIVFARESR